jgi:hypothetical protein
MIRIILSTCSCHFVIYFYILCIILIAAFVSLLHSVSKNVSQQL